MPSHDVSRVHSPGKTRSEPVVSRPAIKLFISHSSKDCELVKLLVNLLEKALGLSSRQIFCTSLPGHGLKAGASVEERIRYEVDQAEVLVGVLSEASLDSLYVACELGARWHTNKPLIPLLAPGLDPKDIPEPLHSKHALQCADEGQLFQLIENLEDYLRLGKKRREKSSVLAGEIKAICEYSQDSTYAKWYGMQLTAPDDGEIIKSRRVTVQGKFKHRPPEGALHIFHASVDWNRWWPIAEPKLKDHDGSWEAKIEFEKGVYPYDAWIVAAIVSKSSADLVRYFKELPRHLEISHRDGRGELEKHKEFDSLFGGIKPDGIVVCDKRRVHVNI